MENTKVLRAGALALSEAEEREVAQPGEESAVGGRPQQLPVPVRGLLRSWSSSL